MTLYQWIYSPSSLRSILRHRLIAIISRSKSWTLPPTLARIANTSPNTLFAHQLLSMTLLHQVSLHHPWDISSMALLLKSLEFIAAAMQMTVIAEQHLQPDRLDKGLLSLQWLLCSILQRMSYLPELQQRLEGCVKMEVILPVLERHFCIIRQ